MNKFILTGLLIAVATLAGCGNESASNSSISSSANKTAAAEPALSTENQTVNRDQLRGGGGGGGRENPTTSAATQNISLVQTANAQSAPVPTERKIVRNAELNLEADSPEEAQQKITSIAESKGGFVVESQQSSSDTKVTTRDVVTITVRVPAQKFGEAIDEIRKIASRVIVETIKGEDVTEEFIDIEARLKAKKALEQQFVEIMKRANNVEDALNVQRELAEVRGEIEKIEGRKRFLENQASLSTIKVRVQTPAAFSSSSSGFFYRLTQSLSTGLDFALNFILGLVTLVVAILPFAILIGLPGFLIIRYFMKKQNRPQSVSEIADEDQT